ncbi:hypothetical protein BpHYR1_042393 [Brachionus plicatilis]|uniref:Uncharacterized protein n=1 Tax=Brachionus plicatilis TaxID=10195 RepID=A0A3M7RG46_BRAPC|nr:hypothetical protein BpHYR1_042393 [Brachionus plicatilis]
MTIESVPGHFDAKIVNLPDLASSLESSDSSSLNYEIIRAMSINKSKENLNKIFFSFKILFNFLQNYILNNVDKRPVERTRKISQADNNNKKDRRNEEERKENVQRLITVVRSWNATQSLWRK